MRRLALAAAALLAALALPASAGASRTQESTFQDDPLLVYGSAEQVESTLDRMASLGADRLRVTVFWKLLAPAPEATTKPAGFDGANPDAYPAGAWERYERVLRGAAARGLAVNLNITAPAPHWATAAPPAERPDLDEVYAPDPAEFGAFVLAVARRFPQVDTWSIYNEPNQPGWLAPQWAPDPRAPSDFIEAAPHLYRNLVDAAWAALQATGQGADTILVGETAPKGLLENRGITRAIDSQRFIKQLYCLDDDLQPLQGSSAEVRGCPPANQVASFPAQHPALFALSGYSHHPYELTFAPNRVSRHPDRWITTANLGDLARLLTRIRQRYAQPARRIPLHLTEFGYQTRPPDRFGVTPARQAAYLNHAEYLAFRNRDVATLAQFLLVDDGPPYDRTFQSGLLTEARADKPALAAYVLPVHLPRATVRRGRRLPVWGLVRPGRPGVRERVAVQVRTDGARRWRTVRRVAAEAGRGYLETSVRVRRSGRLRLVWRAPGGVERTSRSARFRVRRR